MNKKPSLAAVVLAAGEGTRMKSDLPKVAHPLAGRPLIGHVLNAVEGLEPETVVVVVGFRARLVSELVGGKARIVIQERRLGTAHALGRAASLLSDFSGALLVLCGDVPLIRTATLDRLVKHHLLSGASATILSARLADPGGYGRIIRGAGGEVERIVEEADAADGEKAVDEINSGTYCFRSPEIWDFLGRIGDDNRKREYYLTDVIGALRRGSRRIEAVLVEDEREIRGVNSPRQLAEAERILQELKKGRSR